MAIISPRILAAATGNKAVASPEIAAITTGSSSVSAPKIFALSTVETGTTATISADTVRSVTATASISSDTARTTQASAILAADTARGTTASITLSADTARNLLSAESTIITADTVRLVSAAAEITADTSRTIDAAVSVALGTARKVNASVEIQADTMRYPALVVNLSADTSRQVLAAEVVATDTSRQMAFIMSNTSASTEPTACFGLQSINISLQAQSLSESFSIGTSQPIEVLDAIQGAVLDYTYSYIAEQVQWQGIIREVKGMVDVDQTLYTPFTYDKGGKMASNHAERIADALGKHLDAHFDDFQPSSDMSGAGATYQNIISTFFGWSSRVPRRLINAYIRNDTLHIIQRGQEPNTIDITDTQHTVPTYAHKIIRSVWSGSGNGSAHSDDGGIDLGPMYFTGTISGPHGSMSYVNGLLAEETHDGNSTSYSYTDVESGYMTGKVTTNTDGSTVSTVYNYAGVIGNKYLESEVEHTRQPDEKLGDKETEKITYHRCLGNGWWETTVYLDGVYQGASLGQGVPGSKASRYVREEAMHFAGRPSGGSGILVDTEFPVVGTAFLESLTNEIEDFNRCIEEKTSMVIYNYGHLIDFTDKIIFAGLEYHLESNEYSKDPRAEKQSITLVRWFKR